MLFKKIGLALLAIAILFSCTTDDDLMVEPIEPLVFESSVTTVQLEEYQEDYLLYTPIFNPNTYLMNRQGLPVRKWESERNGLMAYMTDNGSIYRLETGDNPPITFGGQTGFVTRYTANGQKDWEYKVLDADQVLHHDLAQLPNGNLLVTVWEKHDAADALANGRDPSLSVDGSVWPDRIVELRPEANNQATVVWEWRVWDHLIQDFDATKSNFGDVAAHPERIDVNYSGNEDRNLTHFNSIFYIEELDQIVVSSRTFSEFWVIDHSTTTTQAASSTGGRYGKGGDLLYRWGNPAAYKAGTHSDQKLFGQHDVSYVGNKSNSGGNFLIFDNNFTDQTSNVVEVAVPTTGNGVYNLQPNTVNLPEDFVAEYETNEIFSIRTSGARRLANGNTIITATGPKLLREVTPSGEVVWQYEPAAETTFESGGIPFKVEAYTLDHPAFGGVPLPALDSSEF